MNRLQANCDATGKPPPFVNIKMSLPYSDRRMAQGRISVDDWRLVRLDAKKATPPSEPRVSAALRSRDAGEDRAYQSETITIRFHFSGEVFVRPPKLPAWCGRSRRSQKSTASLQCEGTRKSGDDVENI